MPENLVPPHFARHINPSAPLGPLVADRIDNNEVSALLFDRHNSSYNRLLNREIDVIIGRRGSGKTALLKCYGNPAQNVKSDTQGGLRSDISDYSVVITVSSHKIFERMQAHVVGSTGTFRPIESIVDEWELLIGDYIIRETFSKYADNLGLQTAADYLLGPEAEQRHKAHELVWGRPFFKKRTSARNSATQESALKAIEQFLESVGNSVALIFDSMDEYMIGERVVDRTVGALLRFVKNFNANWKRMKIKVALPSEIFPEIQRTSANPLRDLVKFEQIHWTSAELMQIAAHRYRVFMQLYDADSYQHFSSLDFSRPKDLKKFWDALFRSDVLTRYGQRESALTYILRHTQLLPRQFLVILEQLIVASHEQTGGYRELKTDLVSWALDKNEHNVASEILNAYFYVYPSAAQIGKSLLSNFPHIFTFDELEEKWKRIGKPMEYSATGSTSDFVDLIEMLSRIGILGVPCLEKERYFEARFSYNTIGSIGIGSSEKLCIHPIFSKHFGCKLVKEGKAILPSGVPEN